MRTKFNFFIFISITTACLLSNPAVAATSPQIASGFAHNVALMADGTVWTWGANGLGQLCNGSTGGVYSDPQQITGLGNVIYVAAGNYTTFAVKDDGTVWSCGENDRMQLGLGITTINTAPVSTIQQVQDPNDPSGYITDVIAIASGAKATLALKSDGKVWGWGSDSGRLGLGAATCDISIKADPPPEYDYCSYPHQAVLSSITEISTALLHTMALDSFGDVWTFGADDRGQLGQPTSTTLTTPTKVSDLDAVTVATIVAATNHSLALTDTGDLYGWGTNEYGQLGTGGTLGSPGIPGVQDLPVLAQADSGLTSLSSSNSHSVAIKTVALITSAQGWGKNNARVPGTDFYDARGVLGTNNQISYPFPFDAPLWGNSGSVNVIDIQAGRQHSIALREDGTVYTSGENYLAQLGYTTPVSPNDYSLSPAAVRVCTDGEDLNLLTPPSCADFDGDGVPDSADVCPGYDDNLNADGDSVPDDCDICPNDTDNDSDSDLYCSGTSFNVALGMLGANDSYPSDPYLVDSGISAVRYSDPIGVTASTNIDSISGNPIVDAEYTFEADIDDASVSGAASVWLILNGYPTRMACDPVSPTYTCRLTTRLGPVGSYIYSYEVWDNTDINAPAANMLADSLDITGPTVELLNGPNMVGLARDVTTTNGLQTLMGSSGVYNWQLGGLTNGINGENQGSFLARDNSTPNSHIPGEGYFILRELNPTIPALTLAEPDTVVDTISIDLQPGWNIISNPYGTPILLSALQVQKDGGTPIDWETAVGIPSYGLINAIYYYRGVDWGSTYLSESSNGTPKATLTPWLSYWVYLGVDDGSNYKLIFSKP